MKQDRLSKITIRGYKSIAYDNPVTLNLQDVTLLIGANGAGKSNILSFFKLLGFMINELFNFMLNVKGLVTQFCTMEQKQLLNFLVNLYTIIQNTKIPINSP